MLKSRMKALIKSVAIRAPGIGQLYRDYQSQQTEIRSLQQSNGDLSAEILSLRDLNHLIEKSQRVETHFLNRQASELEEKLQHIEKEACENRSRLQAFESAASAYKNENKQLAAEIDRLNQLALHQSSKLQEQYAELAAGNQAELRLLNAYLQGLDSLNDSNRHLTETSTTRNQSQLSAAGDPSFERIATRWLNLLESVLTGTVIDDEAIDPWSEGAFNPIKRAVGRDWPSRALTMIGTARMRNLRALTERAIADSIPGDLLEAGVWRGGACIYMKAIVDAFSDETRRVFVADSFEGLPPPNKTDYPADSADIHHSYPELSVTRKDVESNFSKFGLLDDNVVFLEGWFKDTLSAAPVEKLAILRLDGDMYESTIQTLEALYNKISPGGYVIVDDYVLPPCAKAVNDYRAQHGISSEMHDVDGAAVWWQVD